MVSKRSKAEPSAGYSGLRGRGEVLFQKRGLVGLGCGLRGRAPNVGLIGGEKVPSESLSS